MDLHKLQREVASWNQYNFPSAKPHHPLLGIAEEIGELSHAHLKLEQGIRESESVLRAAKIDAVGDIVIFLASYCYLNGIDLGNAVRNTWNEVKKRDWIKYPRNGMTE